MERLKRILLHTTALGLGLAIPLVMMSGSAGANCSSYAPTTGTTVTCSGTSTTGVSAVSGSTNVTINFVDAALLTTSSIAANVRDESAINLYGSASIISSSNGLRISGSNSVITLNDSSTVTATGTASAIFVLGGYNQIWLNDSSSAMNSSTGDGMNFANVAGHSTMVIGASASITTVGNGANAVDFALGSDSGNVDGGAGSDDLTLVDGGSEDSNFANFETLVMNGTDWALGGESSFDTITVSSGILRINGDVSGDMTVTSAAKLAGTGTLNGDVVSSGITAPGNSVGMLTINGNFTQTGGNFEVEFDETGNADLLWVTGAVVLDGPTLNVSALNGATSVYDVIVHSDTSIGGTGFGSIVYDGDGAASVKQIGNDLYLLVVDSTSVGAVNVAALQMGLNAFDQFGADLADRCEDVGSGNRWQMSTGQTCRGRLWVRSFGQMADEEAGKDGQDFSYRQTGVAITAPGNSVGMLTINGNFTQTGGSFEVEFDETGNADLLWVTGAVVLDGPTLNVSALNGATSVYDVIVHSDTSIGGTGFSSIIYDGEGFATVKQIGNDLYLWVTDSISVGAVNVAALQMGLNAFDQFGADLGDRCEEAGNRWQMSTGQTCRGRLWARSFGQMAHEEVGKDGQDFSYRQTGAAIGGDGAVAEGFRLGASIGATLGDEEIASKGGESTSQGVLGMLYGTVRRAGAFLSAAIGGGYQTYELSRRASVMGTMMTANADTEGIQVGGRIETGVEIGLPTDWVLTPRASVLYVHHRIEGYDESGAEVGNVAMDDHNTGSLRLKGELTAGQRYEANSVVYRPHVKVGVLADILPGNEVEGYFLDSGEAFALPLSKGERFRALGGIGLEAHFEKGSVVALSYEGEAGSDSVAHALTATVRFDW